MSCNIDTSKQLLEEKLQSARGELLVVGNDLFSHWEGGMGTGLGGRGLYQMVGRRRGRGQLGRRVPRLWFSSNHPHVPSICLVLLMICPLPLHGLVIAKVFSQFLFASSLNVQLKEVWLVLDNIKKDPTNQYWKCDWQKHWLRSHYVAQS